MGCREIQIVHTFRSKGKIIGLPYHSTNKYYEPWIPELFNVLE